MRGKRQILENVGKVKDSLETVEIISPSVASTAGPYPTTNATKFVNRIH